MVESHFQTSFIPKKPIDTSSTVVKKRSRPPSLLRLIGVFLFLVSLILWGAMFVWKGYLNNKIVADQQSLADSSKQFDLNTVTILTRLNNRLSVAENLLANHLAMSKLFTALEGITLKNIRFTDFTLTYSGPETGFSLITKGSAVSYAAVASQSDLLSQDRDFKSPIFSDLNLDQTGQIIFTINTGLAPQAFLYTPPAEVAPSAPVTN